ncbi:hypothetical protein [uncultured Fibrobacter sp.]|uniref:hypothetical protein n=1 Tax=uncultured Fibrobacter sp. TaxID=261512 RepID=UPI003458E07E
MEQMIILGQGAHRVSARELRTEIELVKQVNIILVDYYFQMNNNFYNFSLIHFH